MRGLWLSLGLAAVAGGCADLCKDRDHWYTYQPGVSSSYYSGCNLECCTPGDHHLRDCGCTKRCACWHQWDRRWGPHEKPPALPVGGP